MAYYAQIEKNIVTDVIVINDDITAGAEFCHNLLGGNWVETFLNDPNKTYAGLGYTYNPLTNDFVAPIVEKTDL